MTADHTPGPWFLFGNGHCVGGPASDGETPTAGVAMCGMARRGPDEAAANARLISAAPDLLEALQFVMSAHGEQLSTAFEYAQDVIAKATGVAPC